MSRSRIAGLLWRQQGRWWLAMIGLLWSIPLWAAVIGQDDRIQVSDSNRFPFRTVGLIETDDSTCTATLIGPRHILTAAHCLVDLQGQSRWKRNPYFTPGHQGIGSQAYGPQLIVRAWLEKDYLAAAAAMSELQPLAMGEAQPAALNIFVSQTMMLDYAVAELDQPIGDKSGWLGLQQVGLAAPFVQIGGYPIDKGRYWQWFALCQTKPADQGPWLQRCDLSPGMSGAAALVRDYEDSYAAIGIYAAGSPQHNYLIPITAALQQRLLDWRQGKADAATVTTEFKHDPGYSLRLANHCGRSVHAVVHYRDSRGNWVTSNWQETPARQWRQLARSSSPTFYIYAEAVGQDGPRWEGQDLQKRVGNSKRLYGLTKVVIQDPRPRPYIHNIRCQ
ncbi:MAG: trypsin-like serine protease [Gammaproteobacteria bacterium]|nr:trypsin-like serine protease [Gammaproteobacteria bacterium]